MKRILSTIVLSTLLILTVVALTQLDRTEAGSPAVTTGVRHGAH